MMLVWAARVWWSERRLVNLIHSKTNWDTAQSLMFLGCGGLEIVLRETKDFFEKTTEEDCY